MLDYICKKIIMKEIIESVWENRKLLENQNNSNAVLKTIELLDKGEIRIAEKLNGNWIVNDWIKKAVILYFPLWRTKNI